MKTPFRLFAAVGDALPKGPVLHKANLDNREGKSTSRSMMADIVNIVLQSKDEEDAVDLLMLVTHSGATIGSFEDAFLDRNLPGFEECGRIQRIVPSHHDMFGNKHLIGGVIVEFSGTQKLFLTVPDIRRIMVEHNRNNIRGNNK